MNKKSNTTKEIIFMVEGHKYSLSHGVKEMTNKVANKTKALHNTQDYEIQ